MNLHDQRGGVAAKVILAVLAIAILFAVCSNGDEANATPPNPDHKVTICHRTGSATNPYVILTADIAANGYVKAGHDGHYQIGNGLGSDIIPAYDYVRKDGTTFHYAGFGLSQVFSNGQTGADVLAAGCVLTTSTPTTPPPTTPPPTTVPPTTPPPTTVPPTTVPPTTTPPTSDVAPPKDCVGSDKPARCFSQGPRPGKDLAFTGGETTVPIVAGLSLLVAGLSGLAIARRRSAKL